MNIQEQIAKHRERIEFLEAAVAGKPLQHRHRALKYARWIEGVNLENLDYETFEFRVKPEPREVWVNEYEGCSELYAHRTRERADRSADEAGVKRVSATLFREVSE